jgi:hypothetical protein
MPLRPVLRQDLVSIPDPKMEREASKVWPGSLGRSSNKLRRIRSSSDTRGHITPDTNTPILIMVAVR